MRKCEFIPQDFTFFEKCEKRSQMLSWPAYNSHLVLITDHLYIKTLADRYIIILKMNVLTCVHSESGDDDGILPDVLARVWEILVLPSVC